MAITLITGAIKSGKSEFAEKICLKYNELTYVALSQLYPDDKEWQNKIKIHKLRRPSSWKVVESDDLLQVLNNLSGPLLIDSIGGFVVKYINNNHKEWINKLKLLNSYLRKYTNDIIIVGEQVGWGLVSEYHIGNKYAERSGEILREITTISNDNWLTINGKAIKLDKMFCDM